MTDTIRPEFAFLNRLRESGAVNMWGASPYVATAFGISASAARKVTADWMEWVNEDPDRLEL